MIRNLIKTISKKEWFFFIGMIIFIILLTTLPYIYGWATTPPGYTYTGLHSLTPGDIHVYFSYMEQVKQGHLLAKDLYTSEQQSRIILNSFWTMAGLVALLTGLSNIIIFQLLRILFIPFFLFLLYLLASYFWRDKIWRKICFIFMCFASGMGVTVAIFIPNSVYARGWYNWPLDIWAPESSNLLTMFQSPHLIAATSLIILIFIFAFFALEKDKKAYSLISGLLALILFQFHPFHIPTIFAVLGVYLLWQAIRHKNILFKYLKHLFIIGAVSSPSILYYIWLEKIDFITQFRTFQNVTLTPSVPITLVSYGLILPLAIIAIIAIIKKQQLNSANMFLIVWLVVQLGLMYSPLPWQRRMMQGLQIPMLILAVKGLQFIYEFLKTKMKAQAFDFYVKNKYLMIILFVAFFIPSHIQNWAREIAVFQENYPQIYVSNDKVDGYNWLKENSAEDSVVLADLYNSNLLPGRTGRVVFSGHGVETLFFDSKFADVKWFFSTNHLDKKKKRFLKQNNIDYIFYSSNEKELGGYKPDEKKYLNKVYENNGVEVYEVLK